MFDGLGLGGFNRPGLGQTLAQHRRTDTKLHTEFGAFVADGSRAGLDAIAGRCSGIHVRLLQDNERITVAVDPGQQLRQLLVPALQFSAQSIDLVLLVLGGVLVAI